MHRHRMCSGTCRRYVVDQDALLAVADKIIQLLRGNPELLESLERSRLDEYGPAAVIDNRAARACLALAALAVYVVLDPSLLERECQQPLHWGVSVCAL